MKQSDFRPVEDVVREMRKDIKMLEVVANAALKIFYEAHASIIADDFESLKFSDTWYDLRSALIGAGIMEDDE